MVRCCCWCRRPAPTSMGQRSWSTADTRSLCADRSCGWISLSPEIEDLRRRTRDFIAAHVLPLERDPANFPSTRTFRRNGLSLSARKPAAGCGRRSPKQFGGMELPVVGWAAVYEEAARSCSARSRSTAWRRTTAIWRARARRDAGAAGALAAADLEGRVRSSIVMTEPAPGGALIRHDPHPRGEERRPLRHHRPQMVHHRRGRRGHFILIARTSDDARRGLTAFLFHKDQPGWRIVRRIPIMGPEEHGGHCELEFDGLEIPPRMC